MKTYKLGLKSGTAVEFVLEVVATDLHAAVREWAYITGHHDSMFNESEMTYFGWKIVKTKLPALQRKSKISTSFQF